ncbi:tail fiber domain-containing protein [Chryseobacterium indologenes]|uniref:tail fiber domain-containing protein n=1 Tax=Chryseobacterium indologenes TaxID=253 RepID=UPI003017E73A
MFKNFTTLSAAVALLSYGIVSAQSVGINTAQPGSTLDVNGSLAAKYSAVTSAAYTMTSADFHISYNGTTNAAFTLPTAISGTGNFKGRMYTIRNNTAFTITITPSASETINGNASMAVGPNQSLQLISTGLTGAASTWDISGSANVTASNGLTAVGQEVRLGGTLLQNTAIDYLDKALYFRSNVDGAGLTSISNTNSGTNASALLRLTNDVGTSMDMFLNSSTKTTEGGANAGIINNIGGALTIAGNNNVAQLKLSQANGGDYLFNGDRKLNFNGDGDITAFGTAGNSVNAFNGLLTLKGNSNNPAFAQVTLGTTGLRYYYGNSVNSMLDIDGNGDINMNRPEVGGIGGNKVAATKGHLDLSGYNTLNGSVTQIYLGAEGFKYSYNGSTKVTIDGNGLVSAAGGFVNTSDMRLKTQVKEIGYGLTTIMALKPKQYELSANNQIKEGKPAVNPTQKTQHKIGFLAQDLYKIIPEAVYKPKDDTREAWAVDYASLVPALTKAIQDQQAEIEEQKTKIKKIEAEMEAIKKKLGL